MKPKYENIQNINKGLPNIKSEGFNKHFTECFNF